MQAASYVGVSSQRVCTRWLFSADDVCKNLTGSSLCDLWFANCSHGDLGDIKPAAFTLVIHGGAGTINKKNTPEGLLQVQAYREALHAALQAGEHILR